MRAWFSCPYSEYFCSFTSKAREAYGDRAVFFNVGADLKKLDEMLTLSGGRRQVPVIVDGEKVTVGFGGA